MPKTVTITVTVENVPNNTAIENAQPFQDLIDALVGLGRPFTLMTQDQPAPTRRKFRDDGTEEP